MCAEAASDGVTFFVSPAGNDSWSGRLADPAESDGPFATIERARDAARAALREKPQSARVVLRSGAWYLDRPLEFGPEDSGTTVGSWQEAELPVVYSAAPGETATISGGRLLAGGHWGELNGLKAWIVDIPEVREGKWNFHQLWVNGERRPRTRLPKEGYYRIESVPDSDPAKSSDDVHGQRRFIYASADIQLWRNLRDVEIVHVATCVATRLPIQELDTDNRIVTFDRTSRGPLMFGGMPVYWVENVFEALDTPGQWYLDRPSGRLYYLPKPDEDMERAEIIAPRLPQLVRIVGTRDAPVKHLRFEGLTLAHTEWQEPPDWPREGKFTGAWYDIPAAISFANAVRCGVARCVIEHVSPYAVEAREGCMDVEISRNRMTDLGAGGVKLWINSARTTVADNEIAHTGLVFLTSYGICVGDSAGNYVIYNHVWDCSYTAILVGWQMEFRPSFAFGNVIEHNHVHSIGREPMGDMGGIYTEGVCAGTRIRYNVVHDIVSRMYGGWGIYNDSGADILVEKNLTYRCDPLLSHYTRNITLENNIFACEDIKQLGIRDTFQHPVSEHIFRRNILYFNRGQVQSAFAGPRNRNGVFDRNLYWCTSEEPLLFNGRKLEEWQAEGVDPHSVVADPLFMDPANGDFRFMPGTAAQKIGFEPWDLSDVGPRALRPE